VVFEVIFGDTTWLARFPFRFKSDLHGITDHAIEEIKSEIATLAFIRRYSSIPVPEVMGWNVSKGNKVGGVYVFMSVLPGRELSILPCVPEEMKPRVYRAVAKVMLEMSRLPRWREIGSIYQMNEEFSISSLTYGFPGLPRLEPAVSARQYYDTRARMFLNRKIAEWDPDVITLAWLYREAIPHFIKPDSQLSKLEGFPLWHADFSNCNLLFDDEYNITGVIDWSNAQSAPWELFSILPHEFGHRGSTDEILHVESRELFVSIFEEEESKVDSDTPFAKFMKSKEGRIAELVEGYQHLHTRSGAVMPWGDVHELIRLMYGEGVVWEDIKQKARRSFQSK
jgi:aminoglycoside phosphotransferase (APT) family kinase protein